jgi:hypothetical protein
MTNQLREPKLAEFRTGFMDDVGFELQAIARRLQCLAIGAEQMELRTLALRVGDLGDILGDIGAEDETTGDIGERLHGAAAWERIKQGAAG